MRLMVRPGSWRAAGAFIVAVALAGWAALSSLAQPAAAPQGVDPSRPLYAAGFKFQGATGCAAAVCHGGPAPAEPAAPGTSHRPFAYSLWNAPAKADAPADPHRGAFRTLRNDKSKAIAKQMGIANPATDANCLACHALNPPENLKGDAFAVGEGVTCNACHGPAGASAADPAKRGWQGFHSAPGWLAQQRKAFGDDPDKLLAATGFQDCRPLAARARQCASCHVAIDPKAVAAGHPPLTFELYWASATYPNRHWADPTDKYFAAKLWAAGQVAALTAALDHLAAVADPAGGADPKAVAAAYQQARSHHRAIAPLLNAGGGGGASGGVAAPTFAVVTERLEAAGRAAGDPTKRADVAKAAAAAARAADPLAKSVAGWQPDKGSANKVLAALLNGSFADAGGFGVEQQRTGVYAVYSAFADSDDKTPAAGQDLQFVYDKLFPSGDAGLLGPFQVKPADHAAAVAEVRARLKM